MKTAPCYSALTCPEEAVFPPEADVCLLLPDPAQDSGDQSDLLLLLLVLDLLEKDRGLGPGWAHLKTVFR